MKSGLGTFLMKPPPSPGVRGGALVEREIVSLIVVVSTNSVRVTFRERDRPERDSLAGNGGMVHQRRTRGQLPRSMVVDQPIPSHHLENPGPRGGKRWGANWGPQLEICQGRSGCRPRLLRERRGRGEAGVCPRCLQGGRALGDGPTPRKLTSGGPNGTGWPRA